MNKPQRQGTKNEQQSSPNGGTSQTHGSEKHHGAEDHGNSCAERDQQRNASQTDTTTKKPWMSVGEALMVFFTAVLCAATIAYVCVAIQQRNDFQVQTARDQRAWVGPILNATRAYVSRKTGDANVVIPFRNYGKTPALRVQPWVNGAWSISNVNDPPTPFQTPHPVLLMPDDQAKTNYPLPAEAVKQISAQHPLYVFGVFEYSDIFGRDHMTRFCVVTTGDIWNNFSSCNALNDTDQEQE